jgi:hypothetical protein
VCVLLDFAGPQIPSRPRSPSCRISCGPTAGLPRAGSCSSPCTRTRRSTTPRQAFAVIGRAGTRPGDDTLDPERTDDWLTGITGSPIVLQLLRRRAPPEQHSSPRLQPQLPLPSRKPHLCSLMAMAGRGPFRRCGGGESSRPPIGPARGHGPQARSVRSSRGSPPSLRHVDQQHHAERQPSDKENPRVAAVRRGRRLIDDLQLGRADLVILHRSPCARATSASASHTA